MVEHTAGGASPAMTAFMLAMVAAGILYGLLRSRGSIASEGGDGWIMGDEGASHPCDDPGSCDGH